MSKLTLYTYCKSSAAYRVRIALGIKQLDYRPVYISLLKHNREDLKPDYLSINPQAMVPTLQLGSHKMTQSSAIIEYLEQHYPTPALLQDDEFARCQARSYAQMIACDIHPLNNIRVLEYLVDNIGCNEQQKLQWYQHWIHQGFNALESRLSDSPLTGAYCIGDQPGLADIFLVPQVYNANRFQCDMHNYPTILRINAACLEMDAFKQASPEQQADFEP